MHWNKSDSHIFSTVAVSTKQIGIDIEYMKERPFWKLSKRWFDSTEVTDDMEIFYDIWCQKEAYTKWKKERLADNIRQVVSKPMIPLKDLPNNCVGYLCI